MKRDMELIKIILSNIEDDKANDKIEGYEEQMVMYHQALLKDAGYINALVRQNTEIGGGEYSNIFVKDLTWEGHALLDILKDDEKFKVLKDLGKNLPLEAFKIIIKKIIESIL